jgi:hypothetical protein
MSEHRQKPHTPIYSDGLSNGNGSNGKRSNGNGRHAAGTDMRDSRDKTLVSADGKDVGGWDAYRRWLTRVQAPAQSRAPLDPGLYTWKGYRNWSDKVRRDWNPEDQ